VFVYISNFGEIERFFIQNPQVEIRFCQFKFYKYFRQAKQKICKIMNLGKVKDLVTMNIYPICWLKIGGKDFGI
jgi:hypothetical protein